MSCLKAPPGVQLPVDIASRVFVSRPTSPVFQAAFAALLACFGPWRGKLLQLRDGGASSFGRDPLQRHRAKAAALNLHAVGAFGDGEAIDKEDARGHLVGCEPFAQMRCSTSALR